MPDAFVALPVDSAVLDGEAMRWFCGAENEEPEVSSMASLSAVTTMASERTCRLAKDCPYPDPSRRSGAFPFSSSEDAPTITFGSN